MKIVREETLVSVGAFANSDEWKKARATLHNAIRNVEWPAGTGSFTICPIKHANGVTPIKNGLLAELIGQGWRPEQSLCLPRSSAANDGMRESTPGPLDATLTTPLGDIALEWETGNISSSHRALNKMALGLMTDCLAAGILVVPSGALYKYLTDRIGNINELLPYLHLWKSIRCKSGVLEIIVIEQDAEDMAAPRIPKGTDGRALR